MALDLFTLSGVVKTDTRNAEQGLARVDKGAQGAARGLNQSEQAGRRVKGGFEQAGRSSQKLAGDLRNVERQTEQTASKFKRLRSDLSAGLKLGIVEGLGGGGGLLSSLMTANPLTGLTTSLVSGVVGGAKDLISSQIGKGTQFIKVMERGRVALTAITKDATVAGRTLDQLGQYADDAGLDLEATVTGAQRLLGFGYALDDLIPKMRDMGDLAASTGDPRKFENIVTALGQMRGATNAQLEEFNQLRDAGVNALGMLSEATGKTTSELREMITAQQISGQAAADLILQVSRRRYSGLAQTLASDTLEGREARLNNLNARRAGEAIGPGVKRYSDAIKGAGDILGSGQAEAFTKTLGAAADLFLSKIEAGVRMLATGDLSTLGKQAIEGAASGAASGAQALYGAGANAAGQLEQGWRDRLDQHSPSRVLTDLGMQAGLSLVFGFVQGMQGKDLSAEIDKFIAEAAERFKIDPNLIRAIIKRESSGKVGAVSNMGAEGLMQLMPGTARRYGVTNSFDPRQNIMGGTAYLADLLKMFNNDMRLALAAYNAGEGRGRSVTPEARLNKLISENISGVGSYVDGVMRNYTRLATGVDSPLPVHIVGGQSAPDNSAQIADLERQLQELNVEKIGRLENIQLTSQRLGRHHAALRKDIEDEGGEMVASDLVKERDRVAQRLDELSKEYEASWLDFERRIQAIEARVKALKAASARPSATLEPVVDLPTLAPFDASAFLRPGVAVSDLAERMLEGSTAAFDFKLELARLEKTGGETAATLGQATESLGAFTAEQQKANLALLMGGQAAGKAKEQFREYVDGLADGLTEGIMRGMTEGRAGALETFRGMLLDMTREAINSQLRGALRSLFNVGGDEGGAAFNPISWLTGKLFKSVTGQGSASTPGFNPDARDNTPSAVRDAGAEAVGAVGGMGEAMARAVELTGGTTERGLGNVSRTLISGLGQIANQIAVGQQAPGFWKGLLMAGASGFVNGLLGGMGGGGGGSSPGGLGSAAAGALGFDSGGRVSGPGGPTDDKIAAWLSNGEYVVRASSVRSVGIDVLDYLNAAGRVPAPARMAGGGLASPSYVAPPVRASAPSYSGPGRGGGAPVSVTVNVRPDAQGRVRSRSQIEVEVYQSSTESARRNS